jgi:phosphoglycerate dehydrogenase-like enzyme
MLPIRAAASGAHAASRLEFRACPGAAIHHRSGADIPPERRMPNLVLLEDPVPERLEALRQSLGPAWHMVKISPQGERGALTAALAEADVVIGFEIDGELPPMPRLKLLQISGAGYDQVDLARLPPGCTFCNVYEHETGIAEYVMAGMLEWTIGLAAMDRRLRQGDWLGSFYKPSFHGELAEKTLGIVGFGHIGQAVARRARAFDMHVGAVTRTPRPSELLDWAAPMAELDARLPECDFVLLSCPLDASTRGLIDRRRLHLMKRSAVLINVARGEVADEDALYEALSDRVIAGAVLDVWYVYPSHEDPAPLPAHRPFHELANVIMSPHASPCTDRLLDRRWRVMTENLKRFAAGQELRNVVLRK